MKYSSDGKRLGANPSSNTNSTVPKTNGKEDCDTKWLLDWIKKMERELQPLDFRVKWTIQNLDAAMNRHKALQAEIDEKSAEVHTTLKGLFESQGPGAEVNVRTAERLKKRWLQLILRVVEYIEFLKIKDKRSGLACTPPKWEESDEDSNEPLTKYRRLGSSPVPFHQQVTESTSTGSPLDKNSSSSSSSSPSPSSSVDNTTQNTSGGSGRRYFVTGESGHKENSEGLLLSLTTESFSNSIHAVVDECGDLDMGQSHEESVFNQSGPLQNSIVDYTFVDASQSVGMKRKLSSSATPQSLLQQHVVPKNISTYYFKHSDTEIETELNQYHQQQEETGSENVINDNDGGVDLMRIGEDQRETLGKSLDFGQEFFLRLKPVDATAETTTTTTTTTVNDPSYTSLELDVDMEGDEEFNSLENVDNIEVLVQNAELLVKGNSKGVVDSVNAVHELLLFDYEKEEEEHHHQQQQENAELYTSAGIEKIACGNGAILSSPCDATVIHQHQQRKSSIGSSSGKRPKPTKCTITNANNSMEYNSASHNTTTSSTTTTTGISVVDGESIVKTTPIVLNSTTKTPTTTSGILNNTPSIKKNTRRTRSWVLAHIQKNVSSCDASAESTSESETSSDSEQQHLSDDPTTVSASTYLNQTNLLPGSQGILSESLKGAASSCSSSAVGVGIGKQRSPSSSLLSGGVIWRSNKKRHNYGKQRPKSFTEASGSSSTALLQSSQQNNCFFVSDTALNFLCNQSGGSWSSSAGSAHLPSQGVTVEREKKKNRRRKTSKVKRRSIEIDENDAAAASGVIRSTSFTEARLDDRVVPDASVPLSGSEIPLDEQLYSPFDSRVHPKFLRLCSDNGSVHTEDLHGLNDQDWDSYQEKYLSEPYSEEPYDPDGTSKLLHFGEDYDQFLDHGDSECSSVLSGFEPNPRKRRPLMLINRGAEMMVTESDSDREELNYLLTQSTTQLRFVGSVFRKVLLSTDLVPSSPAEYAEMEATCEENINSLQLILTKVETPSELPFDIDTGSIQGVLERWHILKEKIKHAAKLHQIQEEMKRLKKDFNNVQTHLGLLDPFDTNDLASLQDKIGHIQGMLAELNERKHKLQSLNEASLGTQLFLRETSAVAEIKKQIQELYALYEENFQLGSYLLGKMRFLQDAWEKFECEKTEFEKSLSLSNMRQKLKKEMSSAASSDSGHCTDFSHDSSISDSDMDFQERRQKLVALRKRASDLKAFLPPGSPVMEYVLEQIDEAQKGFEEFRRKKCPETLDLKIIHPKKRSPMTTRKNVLRKNSGMSRSSTSTSSNDVHQEAATPKLTSKKSRKWRIIRLTLTFHLALMGLLAAAYLLQPKCCEFSNTFRCSLVPHLTHESLPTI